MPLFTASQFIIREATVPPDRLGRQQYIAIEKEQSPAFGCLGPHVAGRGSANTAVVSDEAGPGAGVWNVGGSHGDARTVVHQNDLRLVPPIHRLPRKCAEAESQARLFVLGDDDEAD